MWKTAIAASTSLVLAGCGGSANLRGPGVMLASCAEAANCLSTQEADKDARVEPITYAGTREGAQQLMVSILQRTMEARVVAQQEGYVHATYTSETLGFVDDLELQFPANAKVIEMRIASRATHPAFGTNRKRIEALRKTFDGLQP